MSVSHPNLDVVNQVYAAIAARDRDRLEALHHPDVVLHVSGTGEHAGDYVGREAVLGGAAAGGERGPTTTEVHDVLWSHDHVVVLVHVTAERDGERLRQQLVQVVHVDDGQVTEIWEYLWDQHADRVFWSAH